MCDMTMTMTPSQLRSRPRSLPDHTPITLCWLLLLLMKSLSSHRLFTSSLSLPRNDGPSEHLHGKHQALQASLAVILLLLASTLPLPALGLFLAPPWCLFEVSTAQHCSQLCSALSTRDRRLRV